MSVRLLFGVKFKAARAFLTDFYFGKGKQCQIKYFIIK